MEIRLVLLLFGALILHACGDRNENNLSPKDLKYIHAIILLEEGEHIELFETNGGLNGFKNAGNFITNKRLAQLNVSKQVLEREKLSISSSGILFSHPITYGESRGFNIVENDSANPVIEIKEVISELADSYGKVNELSCTFSYYVWDDITNQFVNLPSRPSSKP